MKKALIIFSFIILLSGCSYGSLGQNNTKITWNYPISINSTAEDILDEFGYPEDKNEDLYGAISYSYKSRGVSFDFDLNDNLKRVWFRGNYFYPDKENEWKISEKDIFNGVSLKMSINDILNKMRPEDDLEKQEDQKFTTYTWKEDGYNIHIAAWNEDYTEEGLNYPKDSIVFIAIEKTLSSEELKEKDKVISEFYSKYNVLHKDKIFGHDLYLNEEKIDNLDTSNIFSYGTNGDYYHMKDSSVNELECDGEILTKVDPNSGLNEWCVYYKDNEYVANKKPYIVTEDFILYTKCLDNEYFSYIDMNSCSELGLFINNKKIDSLESEILIDEKMPAGYFGQFKFNNNILSYNKNGESFVFYNTKKDKIFNMENDSFTNIENIIDVDIDLNKELDPNTIKTEDISFGYVIENFSLDDYLNKYNLVYIKGDNINTYEDIHSFRLFDGDVYYVKRFIEKESDGKSMDIYKSSLIKNDLKIAGFYTEGDSFSPYEPLMIEIYPFCSPKTEICIYDDENFIVKGVNYKEDNEYSIYPYQYNINGENITTHIFTNYLYPVIDDKKIEYLLFGGMDGNRISKYGENKDYELYEGDYPMSVYKK